MRCPYCGDDDSRVTDSRDTEDGIRRRRECQRCGLRFSTSERVQTTALLVVKRDGRREEFHRDKIRIGVLSACTKRPVTAEDVDRLADAIERELGTLGRAEVPSPVIGQMVMERLRALDRVAYVRFASIYRNFQDVESFQKEVEELLQARPTGDGARGASPELQAQLTLPFNGEGAEGKRRGGRKAASPRRSRARAASRPPEGA